MGSIELRQGTDNPLGVQLTYCPRCGGPGRELMLTGTRRNVRTCAACGCANFGARSNEKCGKCGVSLMNSDVRIMGENEKLPGSLCEDCEKEVAEHKAVVDAGGLYWTCKDCKLSGVIRKNEFTMDVRKQQKADQEPFPPLGVQFTKETCPHCTGQTTIGGDVEDK